jgi:glucose/mannose transport system substrate-binding protein
MNSRSLVAMAEVGVLVLAAAACRKTEKNGDSSAPSAPSVTSAPSAPSASTDTGKGGGVDLEVTHWWTSGGEAAAVAELAKAFNKTGNHWVDGAIAGAGDIARPIMISRITGGDPMGATQFNHGRQAEELVQAGAMRDLTDIATKEGWKNFIKPVSLLDGCTLNGKIYCVPVNIHSQQWLWLSNKAFADAGVRERARSRRASSRGRRR